MAYFLHPNTSPLNEFITKITLFLEGVPFQWVVADEKAMLLKVPSELDAHSISECLTHGMAIPCAYVETDTCWLVYRTPGSDLYSQTPHP